VLLLLPFSSLVQLLLLSFQVQQVLVLQLEPEQEPLSV
jgi:hypothetical protein